MPIRIILRIIHDNLHRDVNLSLQSKHTSETQHRYIRLHIQTAANSCGSSRAFPSRHLLVVVRCGLSTHSHSCALCTCTCAHESRMCALVYVMYASNGVDVQRIVDALTLSVFLCCAGKRRRDAARRTSASSARAIKVLLLYVCVCVLNECYSICMFAYATTRCERFALKCTCNASFAPVAHNLNRQHRERTSERATAT